MAARLLLTIGEALQRRAVANAADAVRQDRVRAAARRDAAEVIAQLAARELSRERLPEVAAY